MSKADDRKKLDELRAAIDAVDDELLALIRKRAALAAEVGAYKENQGDGPYYVPSREAEIIRRLLARNDGSIPDAALHGIFREIIGACLALEHPLTVTYLGPEGTFTHMAATRQFGSAASYHACKSLSDVFDDVESGRAAYGVVPVENAFEGAVTHTLDLFVDRDVSICAEILLGIHHYLLSHATQLEDVDVVLSHPQALGQCRKWLQSHMPGVQQLEVASTARAAEMIAQVKNGEMSDVDWNWRRMAAIGSLAVAERWELPVLREHIEDYPDNTTRFLVIGAHDSPPSGEDKTALILSIKDEPGALHALLGPFSKRGIGLSRIASRPSKKKLWEYVFFVDLEGHRTDANVQAALDEVLAMPGGYVKVLGSYPVSRPL
ncbi:MAG: prephenate dehydratase [Mariprofundaceae bacterium]|nr:prephenate dehydratase [Mariprofundaceae bacterium]